MEQLPLFRSPNSPFSALAESKSSREPSLPPIAIPFLLLIAKDLDWEQQRLISLLSKTLVTTSMFTGRSILYFISWDELWDLQLQPVMLDFLSYELLSGFCVGGILLQILLCSFQLCVQGAHYSCLPLCSSPTSVISDLALSSSPYFWPCGLISVFRPFLTCQTARVRFTELLLCPQEGFLTASCEPHISNWKSRNGREVSGDLKNITTAVFFSFSWLVAAVYVPPSPLLRPPCS